MNNGNNFPDVFNQPGAAAPLASQNLDSTKLLLDQINAAGEKAAKTLAGGFASAATSGKSFNDTLTTIGQSLARLALRDGTRALTIGLVSNLSGLFANAFGASQQITPFAEGGVIASPAYFASGSSTGLMGERGAEAVMPLARGSDGRLGVVTQGGDARPVSVTVNIAAQDVESFRRSEGQIDRRACARRGARPAESLTRRGCAIFTRFVFRSTCP